MASVGGLERLGVEHALSYVGPCEITGRLFDLGDYPGLIVGSGAVDAELYVVDDASVLRRLDEFEGYDPGDLERSLFVRRCVRLASPTADAWVYLYNRDPSGRPEVPSSSWKLHLASPGLRSPRRPPA
jgi:gamma-glutamylcyclotransferase (GGCT)/AIG2-like uncharacterized protein YtfP